MANKEQIIIDGVDVSECGHFYIRPEDRAVCCTNRVNCLCGANPNCDYKQLVRKMQEYEELKSESFTREELITLQEKDIDRYRKALEEIEDICNVADRYELEELQETIFNIINKAKGEDNGINDNSK